MKKWYLILIAFANILSLSARDVVMVAHDLGHTEFHDAVKNADLYKHAKKKPGQDGSMAPFTVFVPTNKAFKAVKNLDAKTKKGLITYHVVPGREVSHARDIPSDGVPTVGEELLQSDGKTIGLEESDNRARIINGPIKADNGVVYVVDKVLTPAGMPQPAPAAPKKKEVVAQLTHSRAPQPPPVAVRPTPVVAPTPVATIAPQHSQSVTNEQLMQAVTQLTQSVQLLIHVIQQQNLPTMPVQPAPSTMVPGVQNVVVR